MNIKDIIKKDTSALVAKVEFRDGIILHLRYVTRNQLTLISKGCEYFKFDPATRSRVRSLNAESFTKQFCEAAVTGWEGVTPKSLSQVAEVDLAKVPADKLNEPIAFTQESLVELAQTVYGLDNFIQETSMEIKTFRADEQEEIAKN